ncbi:hypothetical protein EDD11_004842 [Mortierella claussenii]|nr:hypothetical protein EDD11_004842 [Mortierella claussenii]
MPARRLTNGIKCLARARFKDQDRRDKAMPPIECWALETANSEISIKFKYILNGMLATSEYKLKILMTPKSPSFPVSSKTRRKSMYIKHMLASAE